LRHAGAHAATAADDEGYFSCAHLLLRENAIRSERDSVHDHPNICRTPSFPTKASGLRVSVIDIFVVRQFVDNLQHLKQARTGIGFPDPIKMHVWFDHANVNGYDSYPLQMLTFSLHAAGCVERGKRRRRPSRFLSFQKTP
jgi:hypothetical protein